VKEALGTSSPSTSAPPCVLTSSKACSRPNADGCSHDRAAPAGLRRPRQPSALHVELGLGAAEPDANIDDVGWWHTCKQTAMEWIKCRIEDRHNGYRPPMAQAVTVEAVAAYFA